MIEFKPEVEPLEELKAGAYLILMALGALSFLAIVAVVLITLWWVS